MTDDPRSNLSGRLRVAGAAAYLPPVSDRTPPRIHRLSEAVANKIAAGEVVERPASVLKELVENALDAGATRIDVRVGGGGRDLVEVRDDGSGMGREDARLCLERHATSKLEGEDGLFDIRTLGFRGEAVPSIAAVSRFTLLTRPADALEGTRVVVEGGRVVEHAAAGAPEGTTVRVADLFFNVPARRKFLRRPQTEMGHVSEALTRLALSHPEVAFSLDHDGRKVFSSPSSPDLADRVVAALGREVHGQLHPVDGGLGAIRVTGLVASPSVTRGSPKSIYTFVNRRFVRDRQLAHAIGRAYGELVDRARHPVVVLFVELPADEVDVNVHPQKTEVRFANGRQAYEAVISAVGRTLAAAPWVGGQKRYGLKGGDDVDPGVADHRARVLEALERFGGARRHDPAAMPSLFARPGQGRLGERPARWGASGDAGATGAAGDGAADAWAPGPTGATDWGPGYFTRLTVIGQLRASFILCEGPDGLVVVDQHAAHERLEFERLRALAAEGAMPVQQLLVPTTLELSLAEATLLDGSGRVLEGLGFDLSTLGEGTVAIRAVPAPLQDRGLMGVLRDVASDLSDLEAESGVGAVERARDKLLATVACHSVVRAGDHLTREACEALLARMDAIPFRANCPHGRPVAFELDAREIERRFGRR